MAEGQVCALITAGGCGARFDPKLPKQFHKILGKPVLQWTMETFQRHPKIQQIYLTLPEAYCDEYDASFWKQKGIAKLTKVVPGSTTRQASVYRGLKSIHCDPSTTWVMIHDGARCLLPTQSIDHCLPGDKCLPSKNEKQGLVLGQPCSDSLKQVNAHNEVERDVDRSQLWAVQTPQSFLLKFILAAHELAEQQAFVGTDDAALAKFAGGTIEVISCSEPNFKVTHPQDLDLAACVLQQRGAK